jgi:hypothetical protein
MIVLAMAATMALQCRDAAEEAVRLVAGGPAARLAAEPGLRAPVVASVRAVARTATDPGPVGGVELAVYQPPAARGADELWPAGAEAEPPEPSADDVLDDGSDDATSGAGGDGAEPPGDDGRRRARAIGASDAPSVDRASAPLLSSLARETWVYAEPRWGGRRLGYLRAGAEVARKPEPAGDRGCPGGWYGISPRGFVCAGLGATLEPRHPVAQLSARRPDLFGLPYPYALSRVPPPPLYARLPSLDDQRRIEPERDYHVRKDARLARDAAYVSPPPSDPVPDLLREGATLPGLAGERRGDEQRSLGVASIRSGFALLATYQQQDRRFGLTTELALVPLDRTRIVRPSSFRGVALSDEFTLPVAFARVRHAQRYRAQTGSGVLAPSSALGWREAVALGEGSRMTGGAQYFETVDGGWVRADDVVRVDAARHAPGWSKGGRRWIDVSILRQALVAYEGSTPVYVTLVSTGADGLGDPEKTHSTIQGTFLVHTKHVTVTMDGDERGDEFDFSDVPFVQYFTQGYALHGTYWHDDFGRPRSHGCVNLSPIDAAWLFRWTTPEVPEGWHAALSARRGTVVYVHP